MCQPKTHPKAMGIEGCDCGCSCGPTFRHFMSKEEKKGNLEAYRDQLKKEISGLDECIQDLEKK